MPPQLSERIQAILAVAAQQEWTLYDLATVGLNLLTKVHHDFMAKDATCAAVELEEMLGMVAAGLKLVRTRPEGADEEAPKS